MSTTYELLKRDGELHEVTEHSSRFSIDTLRRRGDEDEESLGPQGMTSNQAIEVAMSLLYAVWCCCPEEVERLRGVDVVDYYNNKRDRYASGALRGDNRGD